MTTRYSLNSSVALQTHRKGNRSDDGSSVKSRSNTLTPIHTYSSKVDPLPFWSRTKITSSETTKMYRGTPTTARTQTTSSRTMTPKGTVRGPPGAPRGPFGGSSGALVPCKNCQRSFAADRIQAHAQICAKANRKKRKPYDASKHRIQGTEMELFVRKGRASQPPPSLTKSNWRKKHEEFISNIRAAKQAQMHVAKGGKISDLPPPPPLDTSDYIQCPYCKRKFNEAAADRHIPKCATMLHNKPKPGTVAKPGTSKR